jgi:hypothetical protein
MNRVAPNREYKPSKKKQETTVKITPQTLGFLFQ